MSTKVDGSSCSPGRNYGRCLQQQLWVFVEGGAGGETLIHADRAHRVLGQAANKAQNDFLINLD